MNTLEELKDYCQEENPVGALMLTGEWGCGKTYLVDNVLSKELESYVFLRVSLFGIGTVDELREEVKRCWFYKQVEANEQMAKILGKVKKWAGFTKPMGEKIPELLPGQFKTVASILLSLNMMDFIQIKSERDDGKRVILVFDDLERANISTGDLLGCINDYCENLHMHTIVIANEEKIKSNDSDKIKYNEIKEKIIHRTIYYRPDFSTIISNVIAAMPDEPRYYKSMLGDNKDIIEAIFSFSLTQRSSDKAPITNCYSDRSQKKVEPLEQNAGEPLKSRPHNIRSLKCAIQDFKRIFIQLEKKKIKEKEKWFFSYLTYVLGFRAGLIPENEYGSLFLHEGADELYPGIYDGKCITWSIIKWIRSGEWNQKEFEAELNYIIERDKAIAPEDKIRMNRILNLDESDIQNGYALFLDNAYAGKISLDEYVNMLWNRCWARNNRIDLPDVDWLRVCEGIKTKTKELLRTGEQQPGYRQIISEENKKDFLPEELEAYSLISTFLDGNALMFESNKRLYLNYIRTEPSKAFIETKSKRFDRFDVEMAEATSAGFEKATNAEKNNFVEYFKEMWEFHISTEDYKPEPSENGLQRLKELLEAFKEKCHKASLQISEAHTNRFLEVVAGLIEQQKKKAEEYTIGRDR